MEYSRIKHSGGYVDTKERNDHDDAKKLHIEAILNFFFPCWFDQDN